MQSPASPSNEAFNFYEFFSIFGWKAKENTLDMKGIGSLYCSVP